MILFSFNYRYPELTTWGLHSTQQGLSRLEAGNFAEIQKYLCGGKKSAAPGQKTLEKPMCRINSPQPGSNEAAFLSSQHLLPKTLASHGFCKELYLLRLLPVHAAVPRLHPGGSSVGKALVDSSPALPSGSALHHEHSPGSSSIWV